MKPRHPISSPTAERALKSVRAVRARTRRMANRANGDETAIPTFARSGGSNRARELAQATP